MFQIGQLGPNHALIRSKRHVLQQPRACDAKANGKDRPKVFKLRRLDLAAGEAVVLSGRVSFAELTTRRHYAGEHRIELRVNGVTFALGSFHVRS